METPRVDCNNCERNYKTKGSLMNHMKRAHKDMAEAVSEMLSPLAQSAMALFHKEDETVSATMSVETVSDEKEDESDKEDETVSDDEEDETVRGDKKDKTVSDDKDNEKISDDKEDDMVRNTVSDKTVSDDEGQDFPEDAAINEVVDDLELLEATEDSELKTKRREEIEKLRLSVLEKPLAINPNQNWMMKTLPAGDLLVLLDETEKEATVEKKKCKECEIGQMTVDTIVKTNKELETAKEELEKKLKESMEECSKVKEVLEFKERGLEAKDKELERKKEAIKELKLELIKKKDKKKKKDGVVKPVETATPKEKTKPVETILLQEKASETTEKDKNEFPCSKCDKKETSKSDLLIHMDMVHKDHEELVTGAETPEVCRNGENCSWRRNNKCKFLHNSRPEVTDHTRRNHSGQEKESCKNGPNCNFKRNGACRFSHHQDSNHGEWQEPRRQAGFRRHQEKEHREEGPMRKGNVVNPGEPVAWCIQGDDCTKGRDCMHKHTYWQQDNLRVLEFALKSFQKTAQTAQK